MIHGSFNSEVRHWYSTLMTYHNITYPASVQLCCSILYAWMAAGRTGLGDRRGL